MAHTKSFATVNRPPPSSRPRRAGRPSVADLFDRRSTRRSALGLALLAVVGCLLARTTPPLARRGQYDGSPRLEQLGGKEVLREQPPLLLKGRASAATTDGAVGRGADLPVVGGGAHDTADDDATGGGRRTAPLSIDTFPVAGVDLARFGIGDGDGDGHRSSRRKEQMAAAGAAADAPPFRLHRDFDLFSQSRTTRAGAIAAAPRPRGDESWYDLVELRRNATARDLSFYVDKIAQKRWLPLVGYDIPRPIALRYASELPPLTTSNEVIGESRDAGRERRSRAILGLLPDLMASDYAGAGYAAKPSHQTYCDGVRLLAYDRDAGGAVLVAKSNADLEPVIGVGSSKEGSDAVREDVARRLGEYLDLGPRRGRGLGSAALRGVAPGVVVEERFVALLDDDDEITTTGDDDEGRRNRNRNKQPAMEFKVHCVWGRVVFAAWQRGTETPLGTVRRDGTILEEADDSGRAAPSGDRRPHHPSSLPGWVDWGRVVALAEALSARKDMYRVDVFVGAPAESSSSSSAAAALEPGTSSDTQQRRAPAARYVVSETDIAPAVVGSGSGEVVDESALAEAARLWIAGYAIGNYETHPNEEVPGCFRTNGGVMPENPSVDCSVPPEFAAVAPSARAHPDMGAPIILPALVEFDSPALSEGDMKMIRHICSQDKVFMRRAGKWDLRQKTVVSNVLSCPNEASLVDDAQDFVHEAHLNRKYESKNVPWESSGNWATPQEDFAAIIVQLLRSLPPEAKFRDGDEVFESAIGGGRFSSVIRGAAKHDSNAQLKYHGIDLVEKGGLDLTRTLIPDGQFCVGNAQDLSWVPANRFEWVVTSYVEPLPHSRGGKDPRDQQRWYRWWVYNMSRIAKPGGWLIVAFTRRTDTYSSTCRGTGCGVEPAFFRDPEQMRLWHVDPKSVKIVKLNDKWPKRKYLVGRFHVIMRRTDAVFPSTPCAHVLNEADVDHVNCSFQTRSKSVQ